MSRFYICLNYFERSANRLIETVKPLLAFSSILIIQVILCVLPMNGENTIPELYVIPENKKAEGL